MCRLAYEWMNGIQSDASNNYISLDEIYYFGGQRQRSFNLIMDHVNGTVKVRKDFRFNLRHNDWNGYSHIEGLNSQRGYHVPSYKINENWLTHKFQAFENYPIKNV